MKRIFLLFALILVAASFAAAQRLPELAVPENYELSFVPDFSRDNFAGEETIQIRVLKTTPQIVLNAAQIDFQKATITSSSNTQKAKITLDQKKKRAMLAFDKPIAAGPATLHIMYTGILNNEL